MRWLLLDSFTFIDPQKGCSQAKRAITRAEDFFDDYFNFFPVLPQTLQIEMVAQTGGVVVGASLGFSKEIVLAKIDWARFHTEVMPPSILVIDAWITERRDEGTRIEGKITNEGVLIAEASILLMHMDKLETNGLLEKGESIVFSPNFMNSYKIKDVLGVSVS